MANTEKRRYMVSPSVNIFRSGDAVIAYKHDTSISDGLFRGPFY